MNVSINEIAYDIIELYRANYKDTDSLSRFQVYHWINVARAFLLQQRLSRNIFSIFPEEIQVIPDIPVSQVSGTTRVITDDTIPLSFNRKGYHGTITRVSLPYTTIGGAAFEDGPVQVVEKNRFARVGNRKFNSSFYFATMDASQKLVLKPYTLSVPEGPDFYIQVEGVFQNPIEVMEYNGVTNPYDADYPVNMELLRDLKKVVVDDHFKSILAQVEDKNSDGRDSETVNENK